MLLCKLNAVATTRQGDDFANFRSLRRQYGFIYLPIQINCPILNENVSRVMGQTSFEVNNNLKFKLARDQVVFL